MQATKIKDIRFFEAVSDKSIPISDATHTISEIKFLITEIELESGIIGQGYMLSFHYSEYAIKGALKDLAKFVKKNELHVFEMLKLDEIYKNESEYFGNEGLLKWAVASLNIAMWDAWSKTNNQPVWKLLGGHAQPVSIYGSGGWLSYSDQELINEVLDYKSRGFFAVKIKVGSTEGGRDIQRLRKVREAVGPDFRIMMDANQGLDVVSAKKLAVETEKLDVFWFEEPIDHKNYSGYKNLKEKTNIAIAMGEREYDTEALKNLIALNAIDLWQPDVIRIGGVEGWRNSAILANEYHIPVLPHYYKDYDVPLLCTIPNGKGVESFDWIDGLIDNPMRIQNGYVYPHDRPGWGFEFKYNKMNQLNF